MNKKILLPTVLFAVVLIFAFIVLIIDRGNRQPDVKTNNQESQQNNNQIIFFYGDGCPHCALVENFIAENNIEAKVPFVKKEVYYNKQNADELAEKAKTCDIPTNSIGVPFLWDGTKCLVGDQDIIKFFNQKINEN